MLILEWQYIYIFRLNSYFYPSPHYPFAVQFEYKEIVDIVIMYYDIENIFCLLAPHIKICLWKLVKETWRKWMGISVIFCQSYMFSEGGLIEVYQSAKCIMLVSVPPKIAKETLRFFFNTSEDKDNCRHTSPLGFLRNCILISVCCVYACVVCVC